MQGAGLSSSSSGSTCRPAAPGSRRPQIIYAIIAAGEENVIAECVGVDAETQQPLTLSENFQPFIKELLRRLDRRTKSKTYVNDDLAFHCLQDPEAGLVYICMADKALMKSVPMAFLNALQNLPDPSVATIRIVMEKYNDPNANRVESLRRDVSEINDNLMENLEKLMERREKIDVLVKKSEAIRGEAVSFSRTANQLNRDMCRRNAKRIAGIIFVVTLLIALLVLFSCGVGFENCRG